MSDREWILTATEPDQLGGAAFDRVRIEVARQTLDPNVGKLAYASWCVGRLTAGAWDPSPRRGTKEYLEGTAYDTLIGTGAPKTDEAIQDEVYANLQTDGVIGAGTAGSY